MQMHANKQNPTDFIEAGDIGAAVGFKDIKTGDTLCDEKHPIVLENMFIPEPVISIAVEPKTQADVDKMGMAIAKLVEEDPTLRVKTDEDTGQTILSGMGELHLEIIVDRMRREFKVEINQGAPQVAYKEAFTAKIEHREIFKKQTGGRGKFADIQFEIGPADEEFLKEGKGTFQFVNAIFGGSIPREFIGSIQKGFEVSMTTGALAGFPVESMRVRIFDGSFHQVDSDAMSFELCAKSGFREAGKKAKPVLLEPIMKVEVTTPDQYMGDVTGDLNRRRAMLEGMDSRNNLQVIKAKVPLSEMLRSPVTSPMYWSGVITSIFIIGSRITGLALRPASRKPDLAHNSNDIPSESTWWKEPSNIRILMFSTGKPASGPLVIEASKPFCIGAINSRGIEPPKISLINW
jgi:elongation factor G